LILKANKDIEIPDLKIGFLIADTFRDLSIYETNDFND
jgi:hypothetical protein